MKDILVSVSGLPGDMATLAANAISASGEYKLLSCGLTGPEVADFKIVNVGG